jgi:DNA polymerase sigma
MVGENEVRVLLDKMFEIAGYSVKYDEIVNRKDEWYNGYTMTQKQQEEWMKWGKEYLKKKAPNPEISMILVNTNWGLKVIEKN